MFFSTKVAATVAALTTLALAKVPVTSGSGCNANTNPTQVRLAYAGPGGMAVSWNTNQQLSKPSVSYGADKKNLDQVASSDVSTTYQSSSTWNNHVVISGLKSDTSYHYAPQCGNATYKFKTARDAGQGKSFKFAMVGDMGTFGPDGATPLTPGQNTTMQSLQALKSQYKFIWHGQFPTRSYSRLRSAVGDIAYADAWVKEEQAGYVPTLNLTDGGKEYDKILNEFYNEVQPLSEERPYMVAVGKILLFTRTV
jgi:acid phosphatase type 7